MRSAFLICGLITITQVVVYGSRIRAFNSDINGRLTTGAKSDQSELRPKLSVITGTDSEGLEFRPRRIILVTAQN